MGNAKIDFINFYPNDNWVRYNDSEPESDYSNSYTIGLKQMLDWIKEDGADKIIIDLCNNNKLPKYDKRVKELEKLGYEAQYKEDKIISSIDGREWIYRHYVLIKKDISLLNAIKADGNTEGDATKCHSCGKRHMHKMMVKV